MNIYVIRFDACTSIPFSVIDLYFCQVAVVCVSVCARARARASVTPMG